MSTTPTTPPPLPREHSTTVLRCHEAIYTPDGPDDNGNATIGTLRHLSEDYLRHHAPVHGRSRMLRCYLAPGQYLRVEYREGWFTAHVTRTDRYPEVRTRDWDEFRRSLAVLLDQVERDYIKQPTSRFIPHVQHKESS